MKWYEKSYRRHLADMHIEDWDPEFLRDFSPETYVENLKLAHIESPMIYLQSHVGYSYFPTASGKTHAAMTSDPSPVERLIELCHREGMSVVGYYSLIYNTWAHDAHPEWRMFDRSGKSVRERTPHYRYGFCCPNNAGYREFLKTQIDEIAARFRLEGMFYDMLFWPDLCACPACRERFLRETGREIPEKEDWQDETWLLFHRKRAEWMGEFASFAASYTKEKMPGITVEHNFASAVAGDWHGNETEWVNDSCDYAGGDLYGDLYNHSFTAKYYLNVTKNKPFEYMTGRCVESLAKHTLTKSERALGLEVMLTAAHHGASFIIDAVDPRGTMDRRVYERIGKVFERQMPYEPLFSRGEHVEDVAVFYSTLGRYDPSGSGFDSKRSSVNAVRTLIKRHVPVGVISNAMTKPLESFRVVAAPSVAGLFPEARKGLLDYVRNGGKLYFSGAGEPGLLREFFGAELLGFTRENRTYVAPRAGYEGYFSEFNREYPMPADVKQMKTRLEKGEVLATIALPYTARDEDRFASIHSDPPGIVTEYPSVVRAAYGKGEAIWSAAPLEAFDSWQYEDIFTGFLKLLGGGACTLTTDAHEGVELVLFREEGGFLLSAVDLLSANEDVNDGSFTVSIRTGSAMQARVFPSGELLPTRYGGGCSTFRVPSLSQFLAITLS